MKYFVAMARAKDGRLRCLGREGGYSAGQWVAYAWRRRNAAEKFIKKLGRDDVDVFSVQGLDFENDLFESEWVHNEIREDAESQFNDIGLPGINHEEG